MKALQPDPKNYMWFEIEEILQKNPKNKYIKLNWTICLFLRDKINRLFWDDFE